MAVSTTVGVDNTVIGGSQGPQTIFPFNCIAITPSTDTFKNPTALLVTAAGDIVFTPYGAQADVTMTIASTVLPYMVPVMARAVKSGTTATVYGIW